MTAKEFLLSVKMAENDLMLIRARKAHYQDMIAAIGSNMRSVVVQTSGGSSKTEAAAIGLADLMGKLSDKERQYVALVERADALISKIPQEKFRTVLTLRYLVGDSWKTIRDKMDYRDEKSVFRCHGYALKELQKLL